VSKEINMDKARNNIKKPTLLKVIIRVVLCLFVILIGVVGMGRLAKLKKPPAEAKVSEQAIKVAVLTVSPGDFPVYISGYGEVKSRDEVAISSVVAGELVKVHARADAGETIKKGDLLFKVDPRSYQATADEARASVGQWNSAIARLQKQMELDKARIKTLERNRELARSEYERWRRLLEENQIGTRSSTEKAEQALNATIDQVDQMARQVALYPLQIKEARNSLAAANARLKRATTDLDRCEVRAPFSGRIKSADLEVGQYVSPGKMLIILADDSALEIQVALDSQDAGKWLKFKKGSNGAQNTWFGQVEPVISLIRWTETPDGHFYEGRLHRVVQFDAKTRTVTVAVRITPQATRNQAPDALPLVEGMFCEVRIPGRTLKGVYRLPRTAVSFSNTTFLAEKNRLRTVSVKVAKIDGEHTFVSEGLGEGDQVIVTRLIDPLENVLLEITNNPKSGS
jgi:membrane fusion protein, multidrug efflux system